ncbi:MAG TPA: DUF3604 domain-containing protein [Thermoanaerobaculia bacterium]
MLSHRIAALAAPLALAAACRAPAPTADAPPGADRASARQPRAELAAALAADLEAVRHPSDGGGRAWLEAASPAVVSSPGRWTIRYQAGPLGIDAGGSVFLQVSPFWGWSTPQTVRPEALGYTEVTTAAAGLELEAQTLDEQLLGIRVGPRRMEAGEELRIVYGAGPGARADRFAEGDSRFWIAVDGDGDGVRKLLADSPGVAVAPGPPARLALTLPSAARPGEPVRVTVAVLDARGNAGVLFAGEVRFAGTVDDEPLAPAALPAALRLAAADAGRKTIAWTPPGEGVVRLAASVDDLTVESNPLQVAAAAGRILWGDLQNHSSFSDGSATPEEHFLYARDVAALDLYALTDHDHWGMLFLDQQPAMWQHVRELTRRFHEPGRFVTLLGFEWTNWVYGHRHVLYFEDDEGEDRVGIVSSVDPATDEPRELWAALAGRKALTIAHHTAGGPIATDWTIAPDPRFEPVTEIVSVHGSSEAPDSPGLIHQPVPGNFVRDALARGYRLGFLGSSDGHDGHPGLAHLASPSGGLAAILAEEATRGAVYEALMARHVYATNGPRIVLRASFGGHRIGAEVELGGGGGPIPGIPADTLVVQAIAPGEIERLDVVRSGQVEGFLCEGRRRCSLSVALTELRAGEYVYVRLVQTDGGAAWTSPFYFVD